MDQVKPIDIAFKLYGIQEVTGKGDNPIIIEMFNAFGFDGKTLKDETAWCGISMNWFHKVAGYEYTGKLNARSWLDIGEKVDQPEFGDVVIFWRESKESWKGHVAFFITERDGYTWVLGGNQSNRLQISAYPTSRVLGYRRSILASSV